MHTHPLWRPYSRMSDADVARVSVGNRKVEAVQVVAPDPAWSAAFDRVRERLVVALGPRLLSVEHVGSTSVAGLWAKPVIDVDLTVADSADEQAWLPALEAAGFTLRVREPEWEQHRCLRGEGPAANIHVWSPDAQEPLRHKAFRDWLRIDEGDRTAYGALKRQLAERGFADVMHYNNEKAALIYDVYERIFVADTDWPHDPHLRGSA